MIAVIDYGVGNTQSVLFALQRLERDAILSSTATELEGAEGLILPGVGAFCEAMDNLRKNDLDTAVREAVRGGIPLLGICLGHQILFSESEEHGLHRGLDLIEGRVHRFRGRTKVPHMGWNQVTQGPSPLFGDIPDESFFYFAHSYYVEPRSEQVVIGTTEYGTRFTSAIGTNLIFGTQFHPEKSGPVGLQLLENFCEICRES